MVFSPKQWRRTSVRVLLVCLAVISCFSLAMSQAQSNAADLQGVVRDPNGAVVTNATITARSAATNVTREATTNDDGFYKIVNLTPGEYEVMITATGYKTAVIPTVKLTIGQTANQYIALEVGEVTARVTVTTAARSTVSQEAVQEFQVVTNSFAAEFGRSSGGVVNVVTKGGTNQLRGNLFGFLRHRSFQARNAFAPIAKPPFTRAQYGGTLGGPLDKDRTFFFLAFEQRQRHETGLFTSNVAQGLTGSATIPVIPGVNPVARTFSNITPTQAAFINTLVGSGVPANICGARAYAFFASSGGTTGLTGTNPLISPNDGSACPPISPILPGTIGSRFILS